MTEEIKYFFQKAKTEIEQQTENMSLEGINEKEKELSDIAEYVKQLIVIAYTKGLLALEEEALGHKDKDDPWHEHMQICMLIVDGTDPELVHELSLIRFISNGYKGYEAAMFLVFLEGMFMFQDGESIERISSQTDKYLLFFKRESE